MGGSSSSEDARASGGPTSVTRTELHLPPECRTRGLSAEGDVEGIGSGGADGGDVDHVADVEARVGRQGRFEEAVGGPPAGRAVVVRGRRWAVGGRRCRLAVACSTGPAGMVQSVISRTHQGGERPRAGCGATASSTVNSTVTRRSGEHMVALPEFMHRLGSTPQLKIEVSRPRPTDRLDIAPLTARDARF